MTSFRSRLSHLLRTRTRKVLAALALVLLVGGGVGAGVYHERYDNDHDGVTEVTEVARAKNGKGSEGSDRHGGRGEFGGGDGLAAVGGLGALALLLGGLGFASKRRGRTAPIPVPNSSANAVQLLDERFARGDIDETDYLRRRSVLMNPTLPAPTVPDVASVEAPIAVVTDPLPEASVAVDDSATTPAAAGEESVETIVTEVDGVIEETVDPGSGSTAP